MGYVGYDIVSMWGRGKDSGYRGWGWNNSWGLGGEWFCVLCWNFVLFCY